MVIDREDDSTALGILATSLANDFLKGAGQNIPRTVNLQGQDMEILLLVQNRMERYFQENHVDVSVGLGREGYVIDVGYMLRHFRGTPNRCQYF